MWLLFWRQGKALSLFNVNIKFDSSGSDVAFGFEPIWNNPYPLSNFAFLPRLPNTAFPSVTCRFVPFLVDLVSSAKSSSEMIITLLYYPHRELKKVIQLWLSTKVCLHIPFPFPCLSPPKFIIVPMETDRLMDRMGSKAICQTVRHHSHNGKQWRWRWRTRIRAREQLVWLHHNRQSARHV